MNDKDKNMIDALCQAAILEQSFLERAENKNAKRRASKRGEAYPGGVSGNSIIEPKHCYHIVQLDEEPVTPETFQIGDPKVRSTFGKYILIYLLAQDRRAKNGKRFLICQDLIHASLVFKDINDFYKTAKAVPEIKWLARNTTLTRELFLLAMRHPGMAFVFTIKHVEYANMIEEKMKKYGMDTYKYPPFVAFPCSHEDYEEKYKDLKMSMPRTWVDYQNDLKKIGADEDGEE